MKATQILQCGVCKGVYKRTGDLRRHIRIHTGERPYVCDWPGCGKAFTQRSGLKAHIPVHTGDKNFRCGIGSCPSTFGDASSCGRHRRENHPPVQITHQCPVAGCKSRIKRLSSFRTHLKKHDLDPKEVDLDSCVVVIKRESPEPEVPEVPDFLQVPAILTHRSPKISSRSSSRFSSPLSTLSSLSSLSDVSDVASPYEEPHKDFLGTSLTPDATFTPLELSPLAFESLSISPLDFGFGSPQGYEETSPSSTVSEFSSPFYQSEAFPSTPSSLCVSPAETWKNTSFDFMLAGPVLLEDNLSLTVSPSDLLDPSLWHDSVLGVHF